jgi:hypothetical protein
MERYNWRYAFMLKNIITYPLLILPYISDFESEVSKNAALLNFRNAKGGLFVINLVLKNELT